MELTVDQALEQGVAAHKEGRLQEAERLYRAILQSHPAHPDANHNLGVLAVSVNKAGAALPLFKVALEANPKVEQFWLSYIDALIKEQEYVTGKKVLSEGKSQGFTNDKFTVLETQLTQALDETAPPQVQLNKLLAHYKAKRYEDAEKQALSMKNNFPEHPFAWKILGALFLQKAKISKES